MAATCIAVCPPNAATVFAHPPILCGCEAAPGPVAPVVSTAVQNAAGTLLITFDQAITATPQVAPTAFTVALTGAPGVTVVTASSSGSQVTLVLSGPATFTAGTVTYAPTGTGDLKAVDDGALVAGFTKPVTPM